ncbi:MAG: cystathionine beta-lyase [Pelagibacteraceae bacterium]|nr:cystathionine beta-lyase [Pelagibacteraceae bacterium]|tara:strand:+ start:3227 stop:4381 length:1155 start_codon:yes stop_codon:yes gene_type:complete
MKIKTQINKIGRNSKKQKGFINPPIYKGSTIVFNNFKQYKKDLNIYEGLYGLNRTPLSDSFEEAVKKLYRCDAVVAVSSGLASVAVPLLALLSQNQHIIVTDSLYSPTRKFIENQLSKYGVEVDYYDPLDSENKIEKLIKKNTKIIYIESPGTGTFEIQDIPKITKIAKKHNIATIADNTWASFLFCNPFELGVDVVVEAVTKYINGHSDVLMGIVASTKKYSKVIRDTAKGYGICCGSDELYLSLRGLRTISIRMEKSQENAFLLAEHLQKNKLVSNVLHPGLSGNKNYKIWKRDFTGSSGLFAFELKKKYSDAKMEKFYKKLKIFELGYSWGGYESLITFPDLSERIIKDRYKGSIIRVHCGLADIKDLKEEMDKALRALES